MGNVSWIGRNEEDLRPEDAAGYVSEVADEASGILVVVVRDDGPITTKSFGDVTLEAGALIATLLGYQIAAQMYGDGDVE